MRRNPQDRLIQRLRAAAAAGDPEASEELARVYARHGGELTLWSDGFIRCEEHSKSIHSWAAMGRYRMVPTNPTMLSDDGEQLVPRYRTKGPPFLEYRCMNWECNRPGMIPWNFAPAAFAAEVGRNLFQRFGVVYEIGRIYNDHEGNVEWWSPGVEHEQTRCELEVVNTSHGMVAGVRVTHRRFGYGEGDGWVLVYEKNAPELTTVQALADFVLPVLQEHVRPRTNEDQGAVGERRENPPALRFTRWHLDGDDEQDTYRLYVLDSSYDDSPDDYPRREFTYGIVDYWVPYDRQEVVVSMIWTRPDLRRQGIGLAMWKWLKKNYPMHGFPRAYLTPEGKALRKAARMNPGDRDLRRMIRDGNERAWREAWRRGELPAGPPHNHPPRMTRAQFDDDWIDARLEPLVERQLAWLEECYEDPTLSEAACWDFVQTEESPEYAAIWEQIAAHLGPASWNIEPYDPLRAPRPTDWVVARLHERLYDLVREQWDDEP